MTWMPIETAPKDGTRILAYAPGKRGALNQNARALHQYRADQRVERYGWKYARELPEAPYTHWWSFDGEPMPPPPEQASEARG